MQVEIGAGCSRFISRSNLGEARPQSGESCIMLGLCALLLVCASGRTVQVDVGQVPTTACDLSSSALGGNECGTTEWKYMSGGIATGVSRSVPRQRKRRDASEIFRARPPASTILEYGICALPSRAALQAGLLPTRAAVAARGAIPEAKVPRCLALGALSWVYHRRGRKNRKIAFRG